MSLLSTLVTLVMYHRKEQCTIWYHTTINLIYVYNDSVAESNSTCTSTVSSCIHQYYICSCYYYSNCIKIVTQYKILYLCNNITAYLLLNFNNSVYNTFNVYRITEYTFDKIIIWCELVSSIIEIE